MALGADELDQASEHWATISDLTASDPGIAADAADISDTLETAAAQLRGGTISDVEDATATLESVTPTLQATISSIESMDNLC